MTQRWDKIVVGAGFSGATAARLLAEKGQQVLVVERRPHVAGNAYDGYNEDGVLVHYYGPHILHTRDREVWQFLSRFTDWRYYQHRVLAYAEGQYVPLPVNLDTVNKLFGTAYTKENVDSEFFEPRRTEGLRENARDMVVGQAGEELYQLFFAGYTRKQWGIDPEQLSAEVTARIPLRTGRDSRYFADPYQGMPKLGYTRLVQEMLNHENISLLLQTDFHDIQDWLQDIPVIYTGSVDRYFNYSFGALPYRSLRFEWETQDVEQAQPAAVVNYPNDYDFTRITEFKQMTGQQHRKTVLVREYPCVDGEPYYPMPTREAAQLYSQYQQAALSLNHVHFLGRLGQYKYANMDVVVRQAMDLAEKLR